MQDLDSRETRRALSDLVSASSEREKTELAALLTLSMILNGRQAEISPRALFVTETYLQEHGISLNESSDVLVKKLEKLFAQHAISKDLAGSAERILRDDILRGQTKRLARAQKTLFGSARNDPAPELPGPKHSLLSIRTVEKKEK